MSKKIEWYFLLPSCPRDRVHVLGSILEIEESQPPKVEICLNTYIQKIKINKWCTLLLIM